MYSSLPPRYRWQIRTLLSVAWLLTAAGGACAILWTPATIENELGTQLTYGWGGIAAVGSVVALFGVAMNRYRLEWVAAWFSAGGLWMYGMVVWWLVITGSQTRLTQGFFITALLVHVVSRAVFCAAHAAKLRTATVETGPIDALP